MGAVKTERIANAALFANAETVHSAFAVHQVTDYTDDLMQKQFDKVEGLTPEQSFPMVDTYIRLSLSEGGLGRVYVKAGGVMTMFDDKYLSLFGIDAADVAVSDDRDRGPAIFAGCVLLMPLFADTILSRFLPLMPALVNLCGLPDSPEMDVAIKETA